MKTASELDYYDAKCKTCIHKTGITYTVCDVFTYGSGIGEQIFKIDDDFVCAEWEGEDDGL